MTPVPIAPARRSPVATAAATSANLTFRSMDGALSSIRGATEAITGGAARRGSGRDLGAGASGWLRGAVTSSVALPAGSSPEYVPSSRARRSIAK